jgi:hypothetical protein
MAFGLDLNHRQNGQLTAFARTASRACSTSRLGMPSCRVRSQSCGRRYGTVVIRCRNRTSSGTGPPKFYKDNAVYVVVWKTSANVPADLAVRALRE